MKWVMLMQDADCAGNHANLVEKVADHEGRFGCDLKELFLVAHFPEINGINCCRRCSSCR